MPSEGDVVIADLLVKHLIALVDRERLMMAVARAEDRSASLALEAISGRTINLATGIVMHQSGFRPDDAEDLLRRSARTAGRSLPQLAATVVRSGLLADPAAPHSRPGRVTRDLGSPGTGTGARLGADPSTASARMPRPAASGELA